MPDLRISELTQLSGASLQSADVLPVTDVSASSTKKLTAKDLVQYGVTLIDANSIPSDKFDIVLSAGSVTTSALADNSVTGDKLANDSSLVVGGTRPASGQFQGQLWVDTGDNKIYAWGGSSWLNVKAAGSLNQMANIAPGDQGLLVVATSVSGDTLTIAVTHAPTTAARQFLAGPTASGGAISQRQIAGADLPLADNSTQGAVVVGGGLKIESNGKLGIDNTVLTESRRSVVTYDEYGLVQSGGPIEAADLPSATNESPGVVIPGDSLSIDNSTKQLDIKNRIVNGTFTKVTTDIYGSITAGQQLTSADLPDVPAENITGEITASQIAEDAITAPKIADFATCLIQDSTPATGDFIGQFWFTPSTNQLRVFQRGSGGDLWAPVGFGNLQAQNLRFGGTYNASTNKITTVTSIGLGEGIKAGDTFPVATDALSGMYFLCQVGGDAMLQPDLQDKTHTPGDWSLCLDEAQQWVFIDVSSSGGGGGGGVRYLNDLEDVTIGGPGGPFSLSTVEAMPRMELETQQILKYDGDAGIWKNTNLIDGGDF